MRNLIFAMMAFMLAITACNETEVAVDEVKAPVKFAIAKPENVDLLLKSSVQTPTSLQPYPWIAGLTVNTTTSTGNVLNDEFTFDGTTDELIVYCPVGLTQFDFITTCNLYETFDGDTYVGDVIDQIDLLRDVQPYMTYIGDESVKITYSDQVQTVPVELSPALGRMIITVDACESIKESFDVVANIIRTDTWDVVQKGVPMYAQYSGPAAVDGMQFQASITIFENGKDIVLREFHTSAFGTAEGKPGDVNYKDVETAQKRKCKNAC